MSTRAIMIPGAPINPSSPLASCAVGEIPSQETVGGNLPNVSQNVKMEGNVSQTTDVAASRATRAPGVKTLYVPKVVAYPTHTC